MEELFKILGLVGFGTIIGTVIQHFLNKSKTIEDRKYQFQKEELLFYRNIGEKIISKLMILEGHRELLLIYLKLSYEESLDNNNKFIDLNNTFNKDNFEKNQEEIASLIYIYFNDLGEEWNKSLGLMGKIYNTVYLLNLNNKNGNSIIWEKEIEVFNKLNETELGNIPKELSDKILEILKEKEKAILL